MAGSWQGKKPIQRNAIIALGRYRDQTAVPDLIHLLETDTRPVIRGTAAWALGRIGGAEAEMALCQSRDREKDEEVLQEITSALQACHSEEKVEHRYREA